MSTVNSSSLKGQPREHQPTQARFFASLHYKYVSLDTGALREKYGLDIIIVGDCVHL